MSYFLQDTGWSTRRATVPCFHFIPCSSEAVLGQNRPNPFNENTTIAYFLPSDIQNAAFYIYDMNGKQLKSMGIAERENGNITIYANELNPGMYYYSLIADGQIIGTKQMVLTD